jgi:ACS family tartrate transporter-like MFS transporter
VFLTGTRRPTPIALINSFGNLGGFVGPFIIGRVHDLTGSYTASLMMVSASLLCSVALALGLRRARVTSE